MRLRFNIHKLTLPILFVSIMLQRSPVVRLIAQSNISLIPRIQHVWTALVAVGTVGTYNSITAASGDLDFSPGANVTTISLGESLQLVIQTESRDLEPKSWDVKGLPEGATWAGNINARRLTISGTPTEAGVFNVTAQGWEETNMMGDASPIFHFTITVENIVLGPVFTQNPANQTVSWGNALTLTASVDPLEGTTFQWQRLLLGEVDYTDIAGETTNTLNITTVTSVDQGLYRVIATNGANATTSTAADVTVTTTPFQSWRDLNFNDPFSNDASMDQDPDKDSLINLLEFTFGLNPTQPENNAFVKTSLETINSVSYAVYTFPPASAEVGSVITLEANSTPDSAGWVTLVDGLNGVIIQNTNAAYTVKVPVSGSSFSRLRVANN